MNHFHRYKKQLIIYTILAIILPGLIALGVFIFAQEKLNFEPLIALLTAIATLTTATVLSQYGLLKVSIKPLEMIWQAVWHVAPDSSSVPPPQLQSIRVGHELVSTLVGQIYDLASGSITTSNADNEAETSPASNLLEIMPLPIIILDKDLNVVTTNEAANTYIELPGESTKGKSINDILHMSFTDEDTFDVWFKKTAGNRATDTHSWEQVKLSLADKKTRRFNLAASYSKDNPRNHEVVLILFDKSSAYKVQDQATSYVAMAVHELRTPLTMLRGYIELFEEELGDQLSIEHKEFMRKMSAASQNLAAFVNNILNVARIDEEQFILSLREADWSEVLNEIIQSLELRAQVRGKHLQVDIDPELPTVGIDKISMYEVVNNLVDNAVKYSGQSPNIVIRAELNKEGMVETSVRDYGPGIPQNIISGLFTKFYRGHRSRNAVSGSGLGLYLVKTIVNAHGGNVSVNSKEGEGSTFAFTLQPFGQIKDTDKSATKDGIERQASGWIKNHSLYRR